MYEDSKIYVPGKATLEKRYTPLVNIILLSKIAQSLEVGKTKEQAEENMRALRDKIVQRVGQEGESVLWEYQRDPDIQSIFLASENSPGKFVINQVAEDLLSKPEDLIPESAEDDLKVIATRGEIGGPLGQIHKLHSMPFLKSLDVVIYTNDLKAGSLEVLTYLLDWAEKAQIRVYDDNPSEIVQWWEIAHQRNLLPRLELIQVRNPRAKRRHAKAEIKPVVRIGELETPKTQAPSTESEEPVYDHFIGSAFHPEMVGEVGEHRYDPKLSQNNLEPIKTSA